jgi:hypothetical protein
MILRQWSLYRNYRITAIGTSFRQVLSHSHKPEGQTTVNDGAWPSREDIKVGDNAFLLWTNIQSKGYEIKASLAEMVTTRRPESIGGQDLVGLLEDTSDSEVSQ